MEWLVVLILLGLVAAAVVASRRGKERAIEQRRAELEPVQKLAFEDVTALGTDLQDLDGELAGIELDAGARADYQRALDAYEAAKTASDRLDRPDDVRHVTEIIEDGRYAIACVRARVAGEPLPTRRPPCFFDPRHGLSVDDVEWTPPGGTTRDVPACALDAERVRAGAEPDTRQVMVGAERMPYYRAAGPTRRTPRATSGAARTCCSPGCSSARSWAAVGGTAAVTVAATAVTAAVTAAGDGGGDGGGDAGGDFGGGDFGGGDFGGGDFGGGDFGGF